MPRAWSLGARQPVFYLLALDDRKHRQLRYLITIESCSPPRRGGQWLSQSLDKVGHLCLEFGTRKILISLSDQEDGDEERQTPSLSGSLQTSTISV